MKFIGRRACGTMWLLSHGLKFLVRRLDQGWGLLFQLSVMLVTGECIEITGVHYDGCNQVVMRILSHKISRHRIQLGIQLDYQEPSHSIFDMCKFCGFIRYNMYDNMVGCIVLYHVWSDSVVHHDRTATRLCSRLSYHISIIAVDCLT